MTTIQQEEWNKRYQEAEYVYGTAPNIFFSDFIALQSLKGKMLLPAEGEGRNAVYAACKGWTVDAFDFSETAQQKALNLALKNNVTINYFINDFENVVLPPSTYDIIALIFNHMKPEVLLIMAQKYFDTLKTGGYLIMEAFAKEQINNVTGGPKIIDLLYDIPQLEEAFEPFKIINIERKTIEIDEGKLHSGMAELIRMVAVK